MLYEKLEPYQKIAVEFATSRRSAAIFMKQGTGKTWVSFGVIERIDNELENYQGFIVSLLANLETTWLDGFKQNFPHLNVASDWETFKKLPKPRWLVIHYEYFIKIIKRLINQSWEVGIIDESQRLKNRSSVASRAAARFKDVFHRIILSGTPDDGNPIHYWAQFRYFAPQVFGKRWKDFDEEFLLPTGYKGYKRKLNPLKAKEFYDLVSPYTHYVGTEVLKLKKPRHIRVPLEAPLRVWRYYNEMEEEFLTQLEEEEIVITAKLAITKAVKLQQIASGFIIDEEGDAHRFSGYRIKKLRKILKLHPNEPVVIFCKYIEELEWIELMLKSRNHKVAVIRGGTKYKRNRAQTLRDFQLGKYDYIICQIRTGSGGIDLFYSKVAIFYSIGYSSIDFQQAQARVYRWGQKGRVVYYYFYLKNSIDEDIYYAIYKKGSVSKTIRRHIRRKLNERRRHHGP